MSLVWKPVLLTLFLQALNSHQSESGINSEGDPRGRRQPKSMRGLYTALGVLELVGGGIRLAADAANLGGSILSIAQMLSPPPQQLGVGADVQYPQDMQNMQLQNVQDMQNTQYSQNMQSEPCTATFSYYASNGNPVYLCDCPGGTSYQYLRCVNPDESGASDVQNSPDMQQQNVQDVQEQPCTATFSYYASDRRPVYQCDCPGYGISYQYSRCLSPKYTRN